MASNSNPLFGWDLTYKIVEKDIRRKSDVLIAFIHWNLTKRGFRTVTGLEDEGKLTGNEETSELLPNGWSDLDNYTLRYVLEGKLYVLHGLISEGDIILNLMKLEDTSVSNIAYKINDTVKEMQGPIEKIIPNYKDIIYTVKRDLIDTVTEKSTVTAETQTSAERSTRSSEDSMPFLTNPYLTRPPNQQIFPSRDIPGIGRSDLDPFAPGGQGMIYDPFGHRDVENPGFGIPGGLPRGAVPPGARFDPFGPPGGPMPGRLRAPPDADHLPPPGGFNDFL